MLLNGEDVELVRSPAKSDSPVAHSQTEQSAQNLRAMSAEQRLRFHQERSEPLMKGLPKLTLFLRQAGAPINNVVERALKKAILNRKNALLHKTLNGAGASSTAPIPSTISPNRSDTPRN